MLNPNIVAGPSDFMMPTGSNLDINKVDLNIIMIEHYSADFYTFAILTFALLHSILVKQHSQPGLPEQDQEAVGEKGGEGFDEAAFNQPALEHHIAN